MIQEVIEQKLGNSQHTTGNDNAYFCPKCNWKNPRLMVNYDENKFHCWKCGWGSQSMLPLLYELNIDRSVINEIKKELNIYDKFNVNKKNLSLIDKLDNLLFKPLNEEVVYSQNISLPEGYFLINSLNATKKVRNYLYSRNLSDDEIEYYNIMYNPELKKVLFPSYNKDNRINYFITRNIEFKKYELPDDTKKSQIFFYENLIDYTGDVILTEGIFDAINIGFNAQPLLGTSMYKLMFERLLSANSITLFLDSDALDTAFKHAKRLFNKGKKVYIIHTDEYKDASEMPKRVIKRLLERKIEINTTNLIKMEGNPCSIF